MPGAGHHETRLVEVAALNIENWPAGKPAAHRRRIESGANAYGPRGGPEVRFGPSRGGPKGPRDSAAALGLPDAGAEAVAAAPGATAGLAGELAGAGGSLVAGGDVDHDRAVLCHPAADRDVRVASVQEVALTDADRIAVGRIAQALLGDNYDAPDAIVVGHGFGRLECRERGRQCERGHNHEA